MRPIGIFFVIFGIIILIMPEIVAYLLAVLLIVVGGNMILAEVMIRKNSDSSFKFGDYEILKKKK